MGSDQEIVAEFLAAVEDLSAREVSARVQGVSHDDVARWRRGDWKRLTAAKRRALVRFLERRQREQGEYAPDAVSEGVHRVAEPPVRPSPEPDLPDVSFLAPRARAFYEQQLGSYLTRRWPAELIERAAVDLVNQIRGASTLRKIGSGVPDLTEDQQLKVLEAAAEWVERTYGQQDT